MNLLIHLMSKVIYPLMILILYTCQLNPLRFHHLELWMVIYFLILYIKIKPPNRREFAIF